MTNTSFQESLQNKRFPLILEVSPKKGDGHKENTQRIRRFSSAKRITAVSITDSPRGIYSSLSPEELAWIVRDNAPFDQIIHISCKGRNESQLRAYIEQCHRNDFFNILAVTGDYPGGCKPVFDLNSTQLLGLITRLEKHCHTLFSGAVCNPYHPIWILESQKLKMKIQEGAKFIVPQVGYDLNKLSFFQQWFDMQYDNLPLLGNVFIPSPKMAEKICQGKIPGCTIPKNLCDFMKNSSNEEILKAYAWMMTIMRKMGFSGIHLGGPMLHERHNLDILLDQFEKLQTLETYIDDQGFRKYFSIFSDSKSQKGIIPQPKLAERFLYRFSQVTHNILFEGGPKRKSLIRGLQSLEHPIKALLFGCKNCGDCTLPYSEFLCPQNGCAKNLTLAPCGGTRENLMCEVHPEQMCFWAKVVALNPNFELKFTPPKGDKWKNSKGSWCNLH